MDNSSFSTMQMGMSVLYCVYSAISEEKIVWNSKGRFERNYQDILQVQESGDSSWGSMC